MGHPGRSQTHEPQRLLSDSGKGRVLTGIWATSHRALGVLVQPLQGAFGKLEVPNQGAGMVVF